MNVGHFRQHRLREEIFQRFTQRFSSGCGFWIFGSTISSCATSATFGSAISSPAVRLASG
jgi:hypothetical protein